MTQQFSLHHYTILYYSVLSETQPHVKITCLFLQCIYIHTEKSGISLNVLTKGVGNVICQVH